MKEKRNTTQFLMPSQKNGKPASSYDIYPSLKLDDGKISSELKLLAEKVVDQKAIIIDGYVGVFFDVFKDQLVQALKELGKKVNWIMRQLLSLRVKLIS